MVLHASSETINVVKKKDVKNNSSHVCDLLSLSVYIATNAPTSSVISSSPLCPLKKRNGDAIHMQTESGRYKNESVELETSVTCCESVNYTREVRQERHISEESMQVKRD
jgi:hypothetical protein